MGRQSFRKIIYHRVGPLSHPQKQNYGRKIFLSFYWCDSTICPNNFGIDRIFRIFSMNWEIFGYIGTLLVLGSFLIDNVFRLRLVNTIGSIFWIIYGVGTLAKPTIIVNLCVIIIHLFWFYKNSKNERKFH